MRRSAHVAVRNRIPHRDPTVPVSYRGVGVTAVGVDLQGAFVASKRDACACGVVDTVHGELGQRQRIVIAIAVVGQPIAAHLRAVFVKGVRIPGGNRHDVGHVNVDGGGFSHAAAAHGVGKAVGPHITFCWGVGINTADGVNGQRAVCGLGNTLNHPTRVLKRVVG
ncbi:hypothetical protein D3C75_321960 [compost metagenome]